MSITSENLKSLLKVEKTYLRSVLKAVGKRKIPSLSPEHCPPCEQAHRLEKIHGTPSCLICSMAGHENYNMADRCVILTKMIYEWKVFYGKKQNMKEIKDLVKKYIEKSEQDYKSIK